jgi:hypothetical protein
VRRLRGGNGLAALQSRARFHGPERESLTVLTRRRGLRLRLSARWESGEGVC